MRNFKFIIPIVLSILLWSCFMSKNMKNCEIKEVLKLTIEGDNVYYVQVLFNHCVSVESREYLVREELKKRYSIDSDKKINIKEYLGKMYNEYKYEVKVE